MRRLRSPFACCVVASILVACGDDGSSTIDSAAEETGSEGTTGTASATTATGTATQPSETSVGTTAMSSTNADTTDGTEDTGTDSTDSDSGPPGIACINEPFVNGGSPVGDYSTYDVQIGSHCQGTNQQDITEIERVVFVGDSVTVGTPPTGSGDFYRSILAQQLATQFGIEPPSAQWQGVNALSGMSSVMESGAFASCAVWGARNDDLMAQLSNCFATEDFQMRTLVVFTMGGNDGAAIAKDYIDGVPLMDVLGQLDEMILAHEAAVEWILEPDRFPNGVFVVNADVYEFTDATFEFLSCPTAALAGFNTNAEMPEILASSLRHINEEYMRIAEENGTDVVFMSEGFCGHGFLSDDPTTPCYRGEGNATWFDLTCIHPTAEGHAALAEMFVNTIAE